MTWGISKQKSNRGGNGRGYVHLDRFGLYHGKPRKRTRPQGEHGEVRVVKPADPEKLRKYKESLK